MENIKGSLRATKERVRLTETYYMSHGSSSKNHWKERGTGNIQKTNIQFMKNMNL